MIKLDFAQRQRATALADDMAMTDDIDVFAFETIYLRDRVKELEDAARNLVQQKGRHHTQQAYERLAALLVPNASGKPTTEAAKPL